MFASKPTPGIIFGNRNFFPDHLVPDARTDIIKLCVQLGIGPVVLSEEQTTRPRRNS